MTPQVCGTIMFYVWYRDESISEIPMSPMGPLGIPMGMGSTTLVPWKWERTREWLDENGRE